MIRPVLALAVADGAEAYAAALAAGPDILTPSERERAGQFGDARRREQFLAARWLARRLLAARFGGTPRDWPLEAVAGAAPRLQGASPTPAHLSVSHSGTWIGCALASVPVGLDLEVAVKPRRIPALARQVCTAEERTELEALDAAAQLRAFYRMWTLKEAWLKRQGLGLDFSRMRGLRAARFSQGFANALTLYAPALNLQLAISAEPVPDSFELHAEAVGFGEAERWVLQADAS